MSDRPAINTRAGGFITSYALYGIGLIAALGVAISAYSNASTWQRFAEMSRDDLSAQSNLIRNKLVMCSLLRSSQATQSDITIRDYPRPSADGSVTSVELKRVNCQDAADPAPGANGSLWNMGDAVAMPRTPGGFNNWYYHVESGNVYVSITYASTATPQIQAILESVKNKLGSDMATVVGTDTLRVYLKKP